MKNMLRSFLSFLIALSLIGIGATQAIAQVQKHSFPSEFVEITICSAGQTPKTILIDENGKQVPSSSKCDCPACPSCLGGSFFKLSASIGAIRADRTIVEITIPEQLDIAGACTTASASQRAPPEKA